LWARFDLFESRTVSGRVRLRPKVSEKLRETQTYRVVHNVYYLSAHRGLRVNADASDDDQNCFRTRAEITDTGPRSRLYAGWTTN
jgi:hypothetical protein